MRFRIRFANQVVGVFVLLALAVAVAVVVGIGLQQRWFTPDFPYETSFDSANGVNEGMSVTYKGFNIGRVRSVELTDQGRVRVAFTVEDTYVDLVTENSVVQRIGNPLGLGGGLVFHPGPRSGRRLPAGTAIPSWDSEEGRRLVREGLVEVPSQVDPVSRLLDQANPALQSLDELLRSLNDIADVVQPALEGTGTGPVAGLMTDAETTVNRASTVLAEVEQLARELQPVVSDLQTVSRNARAASAEFADPTGLATRLIDPQGSIKTILNDQNELYNRITSIMSELERTSAELSALTTYLSDQRPELTTILNEGRQTLKTGTDVLESIRSNPLIRGGVPAPVQPETGARGLREPSF